MPCPLCGDVCRCVEVSSAASPRWLPDVCPESGAANPRELDSAAAERLLIGPDPPGPREPRFVASLEVWFQRGDPATMAQEASASIVEEPNWSATFGPAPDSDEREDAVNSLPQDSSGWRQEVAARLSRYQARRKPRPDRYPSLRLRFEDEESNRAGLAESKAHPPVPGSSSRQALALDGVFESAVPQIDALLPAPLEPGLNEQAAVFGSGELPGDSPHAPGRAIDPVPAQTAAQTTARIIEFPRSSAAPPAPLDELAEPVTDRPRILEAPVLAPPPPALGGIIIEGPEKQAAEKRPGIDIPLQSAPLLRRIIGAALDAVIVFAACILFGFVFWKVAAVRPPDFQILGLVLGLAALFWIACQYLLIVYSGTTPGLLLVRLELTGFNGSPVSRRLRRWRVLAS
ncbi:MAG: hypothetical protein WB562_18275, partial [Candidatus Sulfotelmatobacter sp.]